MLLSVTEIVPILMRRDKLSREEATQLVLDTEAEVNEAFANGDDPEEVMQEMLGLEPDYLL